MSGNGTARMCQRPRARGRARGGDQGGVRHQRGLSIRRGRRRDNRLVFRGDARQPFEYAEFPFDEQDLWLGCGRATLPGVSSWSPISMRLCNGPVDVAGIEREFVYSGWTPHYSGFSFSDQPYNSSFGIGDAGVSGVPGSTSTSPRSKLLGPFSSISSSPSPWRFCSSDCWRSRRTTRPEGPLPARTAGVLGAAVVSFSR